MPAVAGKDTAFPDARWHPRVTWMARTGPITLEGQTRQTNMRSGRYNRNRVEILST